MRQQKTFASRRACHSTGPSHMSPPRVRHAFPFLPPHISPHTPPHVFPPHSSRTPQLCPIRTASHMCPFYTLSAVALAPAPAPAIPDTTMSTLAHFSSRL